MPSCVEKCFITWTPFNPDAEINAQKLLFHFRERRLPVFHIRHDSTETESPLRPDRPGNKIKDIVQPIAGEEVIGKTVNSAFIGTFLDAKLRLLGVDKLVLAGLTTPHCISTSARMGANLGFDVIVITDATAAYESIAHDKSCVSAEDMHFYSLVALNGEFASIKNTVDIIENH
jgi:nicotinamidase-related amidase